MQRIPSLWLAASAGAVLLGMSAGSALAQQPARMLTWSGKPEGHAAYGAPGADYAVAGRPVFREPDPRLAPPPARGLTPADAWTGYSDPYADPRASGSRYSATVPQPASAMAEMAAPTPQPAYAPPPPYSGPPSFARPPEPARPSPEYRPEPMPQPGYAPPEPIYVPAPQPEYRPAPEPVYQPAPEPAYTPEPAYAPAPEPMPAPPTQPEPQPRYSPSRPVPVYGGPPASAPAPVPQPISQPAPPPRPEAQPQPAEAAAPDFDPMAPRRDAPIFRMGRQPAAPPPSQPQPPPEAQPQPVGPSAEAAQPSAEPQAPAWRPAATSQNGARYYSVHREAGRQPDPAPRPQQVYLDQAPVEFGTAPGSSPVDLAAPPEQPALIRDVNGNIRAAPLAAEDPSLP